MMEDVRKYVEATLEKLTPAKAQEMARALMKGQGREQVTKAAQDLLEWSHKSRERMKELVRREVKAQLEALGVATRDEVDALRKRVRDLERGGAAKRAAAKKSTSKKAAAKKTAAKRTAAKGSAA